MPRQRANGPTGKDRPEVDLIERQWKEKCSQSPITKKAKESPGFDDLGTSSRSRVSRAHSQAVQKVEEERKRGWKSCKGVLK